jgi:hypothetical protein
VRHSRKSRAKVDYVENKNGYFSKTTNSFQIGIVSKGDWAGDELFVFKDDFLPFTVEAKGEVEVYQLRWNTEYKVFPRDIMDSLTDKARKKMVWAKQRFVQICSEMERVAKWDCI